VTQQEMQEAVRAAWWNGLRHGVMAACFLNVVAWLVLR
jgi:hypothetical protein